jgi:glycine cleavage system H protein
VNRELAEQPGKLNKSPEQDGKVVPSYWLKQILMLFLGWLCKIKLSDPSEVEGLLTKEAYDGYINDN